MSDIGWLVSNVKSNDINQVLSSELASSRMRAGVCVRAALDHGLKVSDLNPASPSSLPKILFMAKYVHDSATGMYLQDGGTRRNIWFNSIKELRAGNVKFVVDYTDHHLAGHGLVSDFYQDILPYVDAWVVPSEKMRGNLNNFSDRPIWAIPEPVEVPISPVKASRVDPNELQLLWFGHNSNLPYLFRFIQGILKKAPRYHLYILSNYLDTEYFAKVAASGSRNARYSYGKWSLQLMEAIAKKVDICIIPGDTQDPKKSGVSSGRLLTALAMGLPTIATPLEAYLPFSEYFLSENQPLEQFFNDPVVYGPNMLKVQQLVADAYTVRAVGNLWLDVVREVIKI